MAVSEDSIQSICNAITRDIERAYQGLSLYFVVHGVGKMRESIALAEHEIVSYPAGNAARAIIRKHTKGERSSFLGIAIANEFKMLGFKKIDHLLGLFNINKDEFDSEAEARAEIYHLVWHAIDLYEIRQEPVYRKKFKSGPMVPKRSALNLSKAHLQADVFAAALSVLENQQDEEDDSQGENGDSNGFIKTISAKRGKQSLMPLSDYKAEDFPSVIAMESCKFALEELLATPPPKGERLQAARKLSIEVGHAFDEHNIQQWWDFSIPAQDMSWRGFKPEEVLGAAVNTSDNPFVRSIGYLIQEVTNIEPVTAASLQHSYNSFIDPDTNLNLHREMVDTIFEEAVQQGIDESSNRALLHAANKQNEDLTEGRILGWCANALQDAARAFERALLNNTPPEQAARMQFESNKSHPAWDTLKELGDTIVNQRRQGFAVTMGHIAEICHDHPAFAPVLDSLKVTMNDPAYIQKLEAANDFAIQPAAPAPTKDLAPKAPGPKGPAPTAAPTTPAPSGPTLGGKNRSAQIMRQRQLMEQKQKEEQQGSEDTTRQ